MIPFVPPFYFSGEDGKALGITRQTTEQLKAGGCLLMLTSLDVDLLTFQMDARLSPCIPENEQEIALWDSNGRCMLQGEVLRSFDIPSFRYSFEVSSVWKKLANAPLKADDTARPYLVYEGQDVALTLRDLLLRAQADGIPIQPPAAADMPVMYAASKVALRSQSYADAILKMLAFIPDVGTRMDYTTNPPTLRFIRRAGNIVRVNYDAENCGLAKARLTPKTWLRAKGVSIHYAQRLTQSTYTLGVQTGGDVTAEADRQISLILSGYERTDGLVAETLATSIAALTDAQGALDAVGASATSAASTAMLPLNYGTFQAKDTRLAPYAMEICNGETDKLYTTYRAVDGSSYYTHATQAIVATPGAAGSWWLIKDNAFTSEQLALAGATARTGSVAAELRFRGYGAGSVPSGMYSINSYAFQGWPDQDNVQPSIWYYVYVTSTISATFVNMSPTAIAAAVVLALDAKKSILADQANFVQPPAGLADNYFKAQDWTPLEGALEFTPTSRFKPEPADRLQIEGDLVDPLWKQGEAVIKSAKLDLHTGAWTGSAGAPNRQAITSLMDALTVPAEDNFE